jgi:glycosyltransferase involved in cell wall biosynthesis
MLKPIRGSNRFRFIFHLGSTIPSSESIDKPGEQEIGKNQGFRYNQLAAMKLVIQIPCFNEAETLPLTLRDLPRAIQGFEAIEILVIDDGSTDDTVRVAKDLGVRHIACLPRHSGLARAFTAGLDEALRMGADVIVNTDADNQYDSRDLPALVQPILEKRADIVVGDRGIAAVEHFSPTKRVLQRLGSWVVAQFAGLRVPDATSGFRALSREAALRLVVLSDYSYTLETLIQAGALRMRVAYVAIRTRSELRPSRLIRNVPEYVAQSALTMVRAYAMYQPMRIFLIIGTILILIGAVPAARFMYFYFAESGAGHIQSLIFAAVFLIVGFQVLLIGLLADLVGLNRKILEELLYRIKRLEK